MMRILHDLMDQACHSTRRIHAVLTCANGATKLGGAMIPEQPCRQLAPHAPDGDGAHLAGLVLVQGDKARGVEDELRSIRQRATHHQRQIRLRDGAQERVMHHPVDELSRHACGSRRNPGLEPTNGGQERGPLRELIGHGRGHGRMRGREGRLGGPPLLPNVGHRRSISRRNAIRQLRPTFPRFRHE
eukprot:4885776-Amphidinium_carterae.1